MSWFISIVVILLILGLLGWLMRKASRKRALNTTSAKRYRDAFQNAQAIQDEHRRILEAEKVVESALTELGYAGSFADKLRKAGPRFSDVQALWTAHKLRNRIAHEMGMSLSEREVRSAMSAFERALKDVC